MNANSLSILNANQMHIFFVLVFLCNL